VSAFEKLRANLASDPRVQQASEWYQKKPPRDQLVIRAVATLAVLAILFSLFVAPLIRENAELKETLERKVSFYELMAENGARFSSSGSVSGNKPLLSTVSQEARKSGITLTRYEQDGSSLRVWVDDAGFDDAIRWIESLSRQKGVVASQVNIDRDDQPGRADIRITFSQGG